VSIAEGALHDEARRRKEGRYADADQIIKMLLALLLSSPPPNRTGPGQLHAGWTHVDHTPEKLNCELIVKPEEVQLIDWEFDV
jgi:hypothetical protein